MGPGRQRQNQRALPLHTLGEILNPRLSVELEMIAQHLKAMAVEMFVQTGVIIGHHDGWSKGVARCPLNLMGKEHLDIHIYSDKISLEIFSNDYQNNFSCNIYNVDDDQKNEMKAIGGDLMIESIRSWELEKTMK